MRIILPYFIFVFLFTTGPSEICRITDQMLHEMKYFLFGSILAFSLRLYKCKAIDISVYMIDAVRVKASSFSPAQDLEHLSGVAFSPEYMYSRILHVLFVYIMLSHGFMDIHHYFVLTIVITYSSSTEIHQKCLHNLECAIVPNYKNHCGALAQESAFKNNFLLETLH